MAYVKNETVHKLKNSKTIPVYEDKSDARRKMVIVIGTLIENFIIRTAFDKC